MAETPAKRVIKRLNQLRDVTPFVGSGDAGKVPTWNGTAFVPELPGGIDVAGKADKTGATTEGTVAVLSEAGNLLAGNVLLADLAPKDNPTFNGTANFDNSIVNGSQQVFGPLYLLNVSTDSLQTLQISANAFTFDAPLVAPNYTGGATLTGNPTAPTQTLGNNSTRIANTAFVKAALDAIIAGAPGALDTLNEIAAQLASDESAVAALVTTIAGKLAKAANLSDLTDAAAARANLGLAKPAAVHLIPGVTGNGTSGNPFVGWTAALNASVPGSSWHFIAGYFQTATPLIIPCGNVSITGEGRGVTFIRSTHATANSATFSVKATIPGGEMWSVKISGFTLDGSGVTPRGLSLWNVNWAVISEINFVNHTDWCMFITRAIGCIYSNLFGGNDYEGTHATPNAVWIAATDPDASNNSVTTCVFIALEFNGHSGKGLFMDNGGVFGNVFQGGSFETTGINLDMADYDNFNNAFVGTDFEGSSGAGMFVRGINNAFDCCNCIGTPLTIEGQGGHTFIRSAVGYPTDSGTLPSTFRDNSYSIGNWMSLVTTGHSLAYFNSDRDQVRRGLNVTTNHSQTGETAGFSASCTGVRAGHFLTCPTGIFLVDEGGTLDKNDPAAVALVAAMKIVGTTVTALGTFNASNLLISKNGVAKGTVESLNGNAAVVEVFSAGSAIGYIAAADNNHIYISGSGSFTYTTAAFASEYAIDINGRNITLGGTLTVSGLTTISGAGVKRANVTSTNGAAAVVEIFSAGSAIGYIAAADNTHVYITGAGSLTYTTAAFSTEYALDIHNRDVTFGGFVNAANDLLHAGNKIDKVVALTDGATTTFDLSLGDMGRWTIGGNRTFAVSNGHSGSFLVHIIQDGTGSRVPTWPASFKFSGGSTLSTAPGAIDQLSFASTDGGTTYLATLTTGHA